MISHYSILFLRDISKLCHNAMQKTFILDMLCILTPLQLSPQQVGGGAFDINLAPNPRISSRLAVSQKCDQMAIMKSGKEN